jgi:hypothetical protein
MLIRLLWVVWLVDERTIAGRMLDFRVCTEAEHLGCMEQRFACVRWSLCIFRSILWFIGMSMNFGLARVLSSVVIRGFATCG